ncbi:MAG: serine protease [Planctomycetota bacterium]
MKDETRKYWCFASVLFATLYAVLALSPVSKTEVAVAEGSISSNESSSTMSQEAQAPEILVGPFLDSSTVPGSFVYRTAGEAAVAAQQLLLPNSLVANASADILSEERNRILEVLDSRRDGLLRWVGEEIDQNKKQIQNLDSQLEKILPALNTETRASVRRKNHQKTTRMIYPIVQLRGNGTVGSGVVISSELAADGRWKTWIVTAYHVVEEVRDLTTEEVVIREIRFFDPAQGRLSEDIFDGFEVASLPESDLSLIRVDRATEWPYVAIAADETDCKSLSVFDSVYAVGCPLGNNPLPTLGEISSKYKLVGEEVYWMVNAPTYFGNSGGGIFLAGAGELIGISSMIYTYGKRSPMVVPHMGLFVPFHTVRSWLRREGFAYLIGTADSGPVPASDGSL